jgi:purine-cytosine permease-like protein
MKKIIFNYLKPQKYYLRLLNFFILISFSLVLTIISFNLNYILENFDLFLLKFIVIFFIILIISSIIEFLFYRGRYISPIEVYDLEYFFNDFKNDIKNKEINLLDKYFLKYNIKAKKNFFDKIKHHNYYLSSIRKMNDEEYELIIIDEVRFLEFFLFRFLISVPIIKLYIKKINKEYKIIRIL